MNLKELRFEGWMGLIVGPLAGLYFFLRVARKADSVVPGYELLTMALLVGLGLLAGMIVWGLDIYFSEPKR